MAKAGQPFDPVFFIQTVPSPHGIVGCCRRVCSYVRVRCRVHGYLKPRPTPHSRHTRGRALGALCDGFCCWGPSECRPGPSEWTALSDAPATFFRKRRGGGRLAGIDSAGEVAAMLLGARQIVAVGRQLPVGVHNAKHIGMIGVRLVADTCRNGKVVEFLVFPDRSLVLKSRHLQRRCRELRGQSGEPIALEAFEVQSLTLGG